MFKIKHDYFIGVRLERHNNGIVEMFKYGGFTLRTKRLKSNSLKDLVIEAKKRMLCNEGLYNDVIITCINKL